jgi:hypothetical protein
MITNFQPQESYGHETARLHRAGRKCQLEWRHYLGQIQLANFVFTFAAVISAGAVIGFILQP